MAGGKLTLREAQAIAYFLEYGRWPDPETGEWMETRSSRVAIDFLLAARLRGVVAAAGALEAGEPPLRPVESPEPRAGRSSSV
jgi:hypothetical protein